MMFDDMFDDDQRNLFLVRALLSSKTDEELKKISDGTVHSSSKEVFLARKMLRQRREKRRASSNIVKNGDIEVCLEDYINQRTGKIVFAKKQLRDRFEGQTYKIQCQILIAFLSTGNRLERLFAYKRLESLWNKEFEPYVETVWQLYHERELAQVIVRKMSYLPDNSYDELLRYAPADMCIREGRLISGIKLRPWTLLFVYTQLQNVELGEDNAYNLVSEYAREEFSADPQQYNSLYDIPYIPRMLIYLGVLGYKEALLRFDRLNLDVSLHKDLFQTQREEPFEDLPS